MKSGFVKSRFLAHMFLTLRSMRGDDWWQSLYHVVGDRLKEGCCEGKVEESYISMRKSKCQNYSISERVILENKSWKGCTSKSWGLNNNSWKFDVLAWAIISCISYLCFLHLINNVNRQKCDYAQNPLFLFSFCVVKHLPSFSISTVLIFQNQQPNTLTSITFHTTNTWQLKKQKINHNN